MKRTNDASEQVPAGNLEALTRYKEGHPWADITPPVLADPALNPAEIEAENDLRRSLATGRIAHGDRGGARVGR